MPASSAVRTTDRISSYESPCWGSVIRAYRMPLSLDRRARPRRRVRCASDACDPSVANARRTLAPFWLRVLYPVGRGEKILLLPVVGLLGDGTLEPLGRQGAVFIQPGRELHLPDPTLSRGSWHP